MSNLDKDPLIRAAAFNWLKEQTDKFGDVLQWKLLTKGFSVNGECVPLIGYTGIWKPKICELPISITTTFKNPYNDEPTSETYIDYRYRRGDPNQRDNRGLRELWKRQIPLIYFLGTINKGFYQVFFPVFIEEDLPEKSTVIISKGQLKQIDRYDIIKEPITEYKTLFKSYLTQEVKVRIHQREFREQVIHVYREQCAFCRLHHVELLDAAHIIGDSYDKGDAVIQNGISLCKIHHAAFDANILGINPDFRIEVREDVLLEHDGPMLEHGLKNFHEKEIILPFRKDYYPDQERIEIRYKEFKRVG